MIAQAQSIPLPTTPTISRKSAMTFLEFLEQRQVSVYLFTDRGNTKITMPKLSDAEALRLLEEWRASQMESL